MLKQFQTMNTRMDLYLSVDKLLCNNKKATNIEKKRKKKKDIFKYAIIYIILKFEN